MILRTYRINIKPISKFEFMSDLYWNILCRDKYWHYFFDPDGITLRFSPSFETKVRKWLKNNKTTYKYSFKRCTLYDPRKHEYNGVKFLGDKLALLFHDLSVLLTEFPPKVSWYPTFERLNHGFINEMGIHNFYQEAMIYMDLANGRARLGGYVLPLPIWLYKVFFRIRSWFR